MPTISCRQCQAELSTTERFCPTCGHDSDVNGDLAALELKVREARG